MLRQTSLATLGLGVGGILTAVGIFAYATENATLNLAGFFYGIPLLLGGLALKAAELKPIIFSQPTAIAILALREQQATATQNQIRQDVTRYRYGQKAHLDDALRRLGLSPTDEERPVLNGLHETEVNGAYALVLEFASPLIPIDGWQKKQQKLETFFGPGIKVMLTQLDEQQINLVLIAAPKTSEAS